MALHRFFKRLRLKLASPTKKAKIMRKYMYHVGDNVQLYTNHFGTEPYLISIHDNVICAANVHFVNHDVSVFNVARFLNEPVGSIDKVGSIELFDNCFVGAETILMPNCSVGKNSIVAAGSIVTKHIPDNEVWGGCPAKFIMSTDDYAKKCKQKSEVFPWMKDKTVKQNDLIKSRQDYFFNSEENNGSRNYHNS